MSSDSLPRSFVEYREALELLNELAAERYLPVRAVPPAQALHCVAGAAVYSAGPVPPFTNSAMDGFAVRWADVQSASAETPVVLPVAGHTAAGPVDLEQAPEAASAWEIMTGAAVPDGFDTVIPVEQIARLGGDPERIEIRELPSAGSHIRQPGEDYAAGATVVQAGETLHAQHIMALHAVGAAEVEIRPRPRVAIITTGSELVTDPHQPLRPGQIRESNSAYAQALLPELGADVVSAVTVADDPGEFARHLEAARAEQPDVIITSGAVSAGVHDFIPAALQAAGATLQLHKLRIRPAKPLLIATLPEGPVCIGLPGNPISTAVALRFLVAPYIRALTQAAPERWLPAKLENTFRKPRSMTFFGKGRVALDGSGQLLATLLPGQESFRIAPLASANAWIVVPPGTDEVAAGTQVEIAPLIPGCLRF